MAGTTTTPPPTTPPTTKTTTTMATAVYKYPLEHLAFCMLPRSAIAEKSRYNAAVAGRGSLSLSVSLLVRRRIYNARLFLTPFVSLSFSAVREPARPRVPAVIQFVTQTEVLITSFRLICTLREMKK